MKKTKRQAQDSCHLKDVMSLDNSKDNKPKRATVACVRKRQTKGRAICIDTMSIQCRYNIDTIQYPKHPKIPRNTKKYQKIPKNTQKHPKIPKNTQKYSKTPKNPKNPKKVKCDGRKDGRTDRPTDRRTDKGGVESHSTRLKR